MDAELKHYLDSHFSNLEAKVGEQIESASGGLETRLTDRVEKLIDTATTDLETRLMERVGKLVDTATHDLETRLMERVGGRIDASEDRMLDQIGKSVHDLETKLITEFHKWGRTSDMRTRQALTDTGMLNERMLAIEDRISALEKNAH